MTRVRVVVATLAVMVSAAVAEARQWPSGHVSAFADYFPNRQDTTELRVRLFAEEKLEPNPRIRITLSGFAEGLLSRRLIGPEPDHTGRVTDAVARVHDAHVELTWRKLDLLLGTARIVWGRLDELQPTDVINPLDVSRFFFEGRSEARLPVLLARARVELSEGAAIEAVYVPFFRRGRFDQLDEPTSPFNIAGASDRQTPPRTAENAQGGLRFSATAGRVDWSVSAYRGLEPFGVFVASPAGAREIRISEIYPRFTMFGGDVETVSGPWGFRGEAALFTEDSFQSSSLQRISGRSIDAGVGLDRRAGDYTIGATVLVHAESYDAPLVSNGGVSDGRSDVSLIASTDRTFARERYRLRGFAVYNASESSGFLRGIGVVSLKDNLALEGSAGWFIGSGRDVIGRFSSDDFGYLRLKYYF
jgi:hypothetical protein